jgi:hypothetical protein
MAISQLPTPPSKLDPATFNARAESLVAALQTMINEINAQIAGSTQTGSLIISNLLTDLIIGGTGDKFVIVNSTNSQKAGIGYQQNSIMRWKEYVELTTGDYVMERFNASGVSQGVVSRTRATDGVTPTQNAAQRAQLLADLKLVDGIGSGLDADLLRGLPADFTSSLATNGYQKLPSGLIIQWGTYSLTGTHGASYSLTFPISFNAGIINLTCGIHSWSCSTTVAHVYAIVTTQSATGLTFQYGASNGASYSGIFRWFAIGY